MKKESQHQRTLADDTGQIGPFDYETLPCFMLGIEEPADLSAIGPLIAAFEREETERWREWAPEHKGEIERSGPSLAH